MEKTPSLRIPSFIQLFLLILQTIYLLLFLGDIGHFTWNLGPHGNAMLLYSFVTSVLAFIVYWVGFFRYTAKLRILFACLFLFHLAVASFSFYITLGCLISRC